MNSPKIEQKIETLQRCIQRLSDKTPPDIQQIIQDLDTLDILVLNMIRAVQLCVDIGSHVIRESEEPAPANMADVVATLLRLGAISARTADTLRWAVGFRNIAIESYEVINWNIVFTIWQKHLPDFDQFVTEVTDYAGRS